MMRYKHDEDCPSPDKREAEARVSKQIVVAVCMTLAAMLVSMFFANAFGQSQTRQAVVSWTAPTQCVSGAPISTCPVSGYIVQKLVNGTWTQIGTTSATVTSFTQTGLGLGTHAYRVIVASAATANSDPSNEASKLLDAPASVTITVTVTITASP